jgi:hypothetical protein
VLGDIGSRIFFPDDLQIMIRLVIATIKNFERQGANIPPGKMKSGSIEQREGNPSVIWHNRANDPVLRNIDSQVRPATLTGAKTLI